MCTFQSGSPGHGACGLAVLSVGLQPSAASGETDGSGASVSGSAATSLDLSRPLRTDCPSICSGLNPLRPDPCVLPAQPGASARFGPLGLLCTSTRPCTLCCLLQTMASGDPGSCVIAELRTASPAGPSHSPKATATSLLPAEGGVWSCPVAGLWGRLAVYFHSRGLSTVSVWVGWVLSRRMAWLAACGGRGLRAQNPASGQVWPSGAAQISQGTAVARPLVGHIPKCPFVRPVLPDTSYAGLAGQPRLVRASCQSR